MDDSKSFPEVRADLANGVETFDADLVRSLISCIDELDAMIGEGCDIERRLRAELAEYREDAWKYRELCK